MGILDNVLKLFVGDKSKKDLGDLQPMVEQIKKQEESLLQVSPEIEGKLKNNWRSTLGNLLCDMFPVGSISRVPKPKTLEIIQAVETDPRGYYTGVYGYFDDQNLDSAVSIHFLEQQENKFF